MPFLRVLYEKVPGYPVILHGHKELQSTEQMRVKTIPYYLDGTNETADTAWRILPDDRWFYVEGHGYYAMFKTIEEAKEWIK